MPSAEFPNFITQCEEDEDGNLVLTFPDELLQAMGWGEGTCLDIDVVGNGIVLRAVERADSEEMG